MTALDELLNSIHKDLGDRGIQALKTMCDVSKEVNYHKFADMIIKAEGQKEMTVEEIANKTLEFIRKNEAENNMTDIEIEIETNDPPKLGPCCICETTEGVRNIVMLEQKSPTPGHGWGCCVCGLAADGASAVLCDACLDLYERDPGALRFACRGYPATDGRVPFDELTGYHEHNYSKHSPYD